MPDLKLADTSNWVKLELWKVIFKRPKYVSPDVKKSLRICQDSIQRDYQM